jgi:hypothetical protein
VVDSLGRIEVLGGFDASGKPTAAVSISQELSNPDAAPTITSFAKTSATWGNLYQYQVISTGNPQATYSLPTAPSGMTINSATGLISWTPTASQLGSFSVLVQASNSAGQNSQPYTVTVGNPSPTAPSGVTVTGLTGTTVSLSWTASNDPSGGLSYGVYRVTHTGIRGAIIVYTLLGTTTGTSFKVTGLTSGLSYQLTVKATDGSGRTSAYSSPYVSVLTQDAPVLTSPSGNYITGTANHLVTVHLLALGAPTLTYKLLNGPSGMKINATTGVVTWTPPESAAGYGTSASFQVSNSSGSSTLGFVFSVLPNLPVIQYTSPDLIGGTLYATPKSAFSMKLSDSFSHSTITWSVLDGPTGLSVNASTGAVTWTPAAGIYLGPYTATFQAKNYTGTVTLTVPLLVTFATGPVSFQASNLSSTNGTADLTWSPPATSSSTISNYRITVSYISAGVAQLETFLVNSTSRKDTLTGLPAGTTFNVSIAALDALGDVGTSSLLTFSL